MGTLHPYPTGGPAVPELPPIPTGALAVGLCDLLKAAAGLPQPRFIAISEQRQEFALQFPSDRDGSKAVTAWAMRFGGVLASHVCEPDGTARQHIQASFGYYGVAVEAFAFLPATGQENQS